MLRLPDATHENAMEYHVPLPAAPTDLVELDETLRRQDPAAMVDVDASGSTLRISSAMAATDLAEALRARPAHRHPRRGAAAFGVLRRLLGLSLAGG